MTRPRYFTGRQVVTIVVAICLTIVLMPAAVWAASTSLVRITDGSGNVAQVDAKGHLLVTDGNGAMTVDGKVAIKGSVATSRHDRRSERADAQGARGQLRPAEHGRCLEHDRLRPVSSTT